MAYLGTWGTPSILSSAVWNSDGVDALCGLGLDWFWAVAPYPHTDVTAYAAQIKASGTDIILRAYFWDATGLDTYWQANYEANFPHDTGWTNLITDPDCIAICVAQILEEIALLGVANIAGITISEEEPSHGYNYITANYDIEDFISAWNSIYDGVKDTYPDLPIWSHIIPIGAIGDFAGFSDAELAQINCEVLGTGTFDKDIPDVAAIASRISDIADTQAKPSMFMMFASTTPDAWGEPDADPDNIIPTHDAIVAEGIDYVCFFAQRLEAEDPAMGNLLFNDWTPDGLPAKEDPDLHKKAILDLIGSYIYGSIAGANISVYGTIAGNTITLYG